MIMLSCDAKLMQSCLNVLEEHVHTPPPAIENLVNNFYIMTTKLQLMLPLLLRSDFISDET